MVQGLYGLHGLKFKSIRKKQLSINLEETVNEFLSEHDGKIVDIQTTISDSTIAVNILYLEDSENK